MAILRDLLFETDFAASDDLHATSGGDHLSKSLKDARNVISNWNPPEMTISRGHFPMLLLHVFNKSVVLRRLALFFPDKSRTGWDLIYTGI